MMRIFIIFVIVLGIVACSNSSETPVAKGNKEQILHIGNGDEPQDIDPHVTTGMPESRIQRAVFEGLTTLDGKSLEVIPAAASSWTISPDQTLYTFTIRDNAKWSNGDPLTAHDFVWSWQRALMPKLGNQYAYQLYIFKNAKAFSEGEINDFSQVGVKALSDKQLQVTLNKPVPYFLQLLDHHSMYPVHRATIEKHGEVDQRGNPWARPENFVGNGPFVMDKWVQKQIISVKKNNFYWDKDNILLNEVHYHPVQQATAEERMFRAGQLHIINKLQSSKIPAYRSEKHPAYREFPYFATYFYRFNTTIKPLDDVKVRKALAYSLNKELITQKVTLANQPIAQSLTPPGTLGYTSKAKMPYDPALAKKLLSEAGYPNGKGFPQLTILYNTLEDHKKIALAVQAMWKETLNIDITLENQDWKVFLSNQRNMNYQIARASWVGDYYDPNTFLDMFVTNGGNNETGWSNKQYDHHIRAAALSASKEERYAHFQAAEKLLVDEIPILPIYTYTRNFLVSPSVKGWHDDILDYVSFKGVHLVDTP